MSYFLRFSLHKRSNGVYYLLYYQNGRQRWKSTKATTKSEALRALANIKQLFEARLTSISFEQFSQRFMAASDLAAGTLQRYRFIFQHFTPFVRGAFVNEITAETIDSYKAKRLREVSAVTVNIELRMLKAAFGVAKKWRMTNQNPFEQVTLARIPEQAPLCLSQEDMQKFLSCIRGGWFRELVLFAVMTGMRRGEILNLRWSDVDLKRSLLSIQSNATWRTKHGKRRLVPLNETARLLLASRVGKSPSAYVFTLSDQRISGSTVCHAFKRYVRDAKLTNQRARFHSLRHTFASWLVQDGVSLYEVQKLLGHSSSKVTEVYSHLQPEQLHNTVNRINLSLN